MNKLYGVSLVLGVSLALSASAQRVVSFNVDVNGTIPSNATSMAGVVEVGWWNNSWTIDSNDNLPDGIYADLIDSVGETTTIDVTFSGFNIVSAINEHPGMDLNGTWNKELLNGYVNAGSGQEDGVSTITLSEIPYEAYHVIVYFASDDTSRVGTVSDGSTTFDFDLLNNSIVGDNGIMVQTTSTSGEEPEANFALFPNLTGQTQVLTVDIPAWGGIAGFQIIDMLDPGEYVAIPEPGTLSLLLGCLGIFLFRRGRAA